MKNHIGERIVKVPVRHAESVNNARAKQHDPRTDRVGSYQPKVTLGINEVDERYALPNASAFVLARDESGVWVERGRIIPAARYS